MRTAIESFSERKIALIKNAQDTAKEVFFKNANVKKLLSKESSGNEYKRVVDIIIQKLIDDGIISDQLELANAFGRRISGKR